MARLELIHDMAADGSTHVVRARGKMDVFSFGDLKVFFEGLRQQDKAARIVVDMADLEYVASSGWSVLLGWRKLMRLGGGSVLLSGLRPEVQRVYDAMRIVKLLPTCPDVETAVRQINAEGPLADDADE